MPDIKKIADEADIIVDGYAFKKKDGRWRILNLDNTEHASVFSSDGDVLETTMDDIELGIVKDYFQRNKSYAEED